MQNVSKLNVTVAETKQVDISHFKCITEQFVLTCSPGWKWKFLSGQSATRIQQNMCNYCLVPP